MTSRFSDIQKDVSAFMDAAGQTVRLTPQNIPGDEIDLRIRLITEEYDETLDALLHLADPGIPPGGTLGWLAEFADGVADLVYVLVGTTLAMGIDMNEVWSEVQRANMQKITGPIRPDGKRLKPEGWTPPNIEGVLHVQRREHEESATSRAAESQGQVRGQTTLEEVRGWNCP